MARSPDPRLLRGQLSHRLRRLRAEADVTQESVAEQLGWSESKVIRIENSNVGISATDLRALLALYGLREEREVNGLVAMAKDARSQTWYAPYASVLSSQFRMLLAYESYASSIRQVHPLLIPGLLQIEPYARAQLAPVVGDDQLELVVEARMERQRHLMSDPPDYSVLVDESAIRRPVGGTDVMLTQLRSLLKVMDSVAVQVIPFSAGMYGGLAEPFLLLQLDDDLGVDTDQVVFLENMRSDYLVLDSGRVAEYSQKWSAMQRLALSESDSADLIQQQIDLLGSN